MTVLDESDLADVGAVDAAEAEIDAVPEPDEIESRDDDRVTFAQVRRPLLATGLATTASGLVVGGIFGSWTARGICLVAAWAGTGWVYVTRRSRNPIMTQLVVVPMLLALGFVALSGTSGGGPNRLPQLMADSIESGRLFRPPVPFDPGWRPLLVFLLGLLAFGAGSLAVVQGRPKVGIAITVPLTLLALISQPDDDAFLSGVFAFLPLLGAIAVLFGDDGSRASELGTTFELKRAVRGAAAAVVVVAVLLGLNSTTVLFPDPVYDPEDQPQKPRAVPLSAARDRVLFEVDGPSTLTGPWRIGALDVYDDDAFQSVFSEGRLEEIGSTGVLSDLRTGQTLEEVTLTVRDLGDQSQAPMVAGSTSANFVGGKPNIRYDPRYEVLRVPNGRVPRDTVYTLAYPPYATDDELGAATPGSGDDFETTLAVPDPPPIVDDLLRQAPPNPWLRLDFLRTTLLDRVVASGAGSPTDVSTERVNEILAPLTAEEDGEERAGVGNEATPFEIVATEALLARWAGVPSRVGFGFDGLNVEADLRTVRPRNSAQWLEVYFEGFGWVPLIGQPEQAKASLEDDPNARDSSEITAGADVAVQVYIIFERRDFQLLFERIRDQILRVGPFVLLGLLAYAVYPAVAKAWRGRRRRSWAAGIGPLAQVAVEYAEFRDTCIDLGVGDDFDTPLEYYFKVTPDREHEELAWLATRALYGDLTDALNDVDVGRAAALSRSVRTRVLRAQPVQSQALALVSRASVEVPYTHEIPNIRTIRIWPVVRRAGARVFGPIVGVVRRTSGAVLRGIRATIETPRRAVLARLGARSDQP